MPVDARLSCRDQATSSARFPPAGFQVRRLLPQPGDSSHVTRDRCLREVLPDETPQSFGHATKDELKTFENDTRLQSGLVDSWTVQPTTRPRS